MITFTVHFRPERPLVQPVFEIPVEGRYVNHNIYEFAVRDEDQERFAESQQGFTVAGAES